MPISKKATIQVTNKMDEVADFLQKYAKVYGVPRDVARDFVQTLDKMSDFIEKSAGIDRQADFDASTIGETKGGPLMHDPDEPYMADHFTQVEGEEVLNFQRSLGGKSASVESWDDDDEFLF